MSLTACPQGYDGNVAMATLGEDCRCMMGQGLMAKFHLAWQFYEEEGPEHGQQKKTKIVGAT